jgi:D-proline reductase (dithiol) PrdB
MASANLLFVPVSKGIYRFPCWRQPVAEPDISRKWSPIMTTDSINYIGTLTSLYQSLGYTPYKWVKNEDIAPFAPFKKKLAQCRIGMIASGGIYVTGQKAFHYKDDASYRMIPKAVKTADLRFSHFAYDMTDARKDPNVIFPVDTLRNLVKQGVVGELADHLLTFMGGIYSARKVKDDLAPRLTDRLIREKVDAVLLVPA